MFIQRPTAQPHTLSFGQGSLTLLAAGGWAAGSEIWHRLSGSLRTGASDPIITAPAEVAALIVGFGNQTLAEHLSKPSISSPTTQPSRRSL